MKACSNGLTGLPKGDLADGVDTRPKPGLGLGIGILGLNWDACGLAGRRVLMVVLLYAEEGMPLMTLKVWKAVSLDRHTPVVSNEYSKRKR